MRLRISLSSATAEAGGIALQPLRAILIVPDPSLAAEFLALLDRVPIELAAQLDSYPREEELAELASGLRPDLVVMDTASAPNQACGLIHKLSAEHPEAHTIALHHRNDAAILMRALRMGATEFLHAPLSAGELRDATVRVRTLLAGSPPRRRTGMVVGFASAKPGSGCSTVSEQVALALRQLSGERVLLMDCDLNAGTLGPIGPARRGSLVDCLRSSAEAERPDWSSLTQFFQRIDVLQAPEWPPNEALDVTRLEPLLESARRHYDWTVLDLPPAFDKLSRAALSFCDRCFLVSTTELPSLHLARRAADLLRRQERPPHRLEILLNRQSRPALDRDVVAEILACPVAETLPNDYLSLHRLEKLERLPAGSRLGNLLERFARNLIEYRERAAASLQSRRLALPTVA